MIAPTLIHATMEASKYATTRIMDRPHEDCAALEAKSPADRLVDLFVALPIEDAIPAWNRLRAAASKMGLRCTVHLTFREVQAMHQAYLAEPEMGMRGIASRYGIAQATLCKAFQRYRFPVRAKGSRRGRRHNQAPVPGANPC